MAYAAVHLFLAEKLKKEEGESQGYLFGSMLPDTEHLMKKELVQDKKDGHSRHEAKERFLEAFRGEEGLKAGIRLHFLVDEIVHGSYLPEKIEKFKQWEPALVHFLTEVVMDRVLARKNKWLAKRYNEVAEKVDLEACGKKLEEIFPEGKGKGSEILKDGIEMERISNLSSWLRINKARKIVKRYNRFTHINPHPLKIFYMMKRIEKEVKKDLDGFLERAEKELKGKV